MTDLTDIVDIERLSPASSMCTALYRIGAPIRTPAGEVTVRAALLDGTRRRPVVALSVTDLTADPDDCDDDEPVYAGADLSPAHARQLALLLLTAADHAERLVSGGDR